MPARKKHPLRAKLLTLLVSTIVALAIAELALNLIGFAFPSFYAADDLTGFSLIPGEEDYFVHEGRSLVRVNSRGWRDVERTVEKPPGAFRIAVLGDSMTEAMHVDLADTFPRLIEKRLGAGPIAGREKVEVLNFGVSNYGTAQEYLVLRERALAFDPDLVLLVFFAGNDLANNSKELNAPVGSPYFLIEGDRLVLDDSFRTTQAFAEKKGFYRRQIFPLLQKFRLFQLFRKVKWLMQSEQQPAPDDPYEADNRYGELGLNSEVFFPPRSEAWRQAWLVTERLFLEMNELCADRGVLFGIIVASMPVQVHPDPEYRRGYAARLGAADLSYADRRVEAFCNEYNIPVLVLADKMSPYVEGTKAYLHGFPNSKLGTGHYNEEGHKVVARLVTEWLATWPEFRVAHSDRGR